jgi:hypothetical protein
MSIDGTQVATLTVGGLGTVTYMIDPSQLSLAPGRHTVRLNSLLRGSTQAAARSVTGRRRRSGRWMAGGR